MTADWLKEAGGTPLWAARLDSMIHCWLASRACTVAEKTLRTDQDLLRLIPPSYLSRDPRTITGGDIDGLLVSFRARGLSELSVRRHRASLSQFFRWMQRIGVISDTPLASATAPVRPTPATVRPFSAAELHSAWIEWAQHDRRLADVLLILARTGLRWSEARALTVQDFSPTSHQILVDKSSSEGTAVRRLSSGLVRRVPIVQEVRGRVRAMARHRDPDELLFTTDRGCQLHRTAVLRRLDWSHTGRGRRLNDLRHTAAQLWLDDGVSPATVREWMGHTVMTGHPQTRTA